MLVVRFHQQAGNRPFLAHTANDASLRITPGWRGGPDHASHGTHLVFGKIEFKCENAKFR